MPIQPDEKGRGAATRPRPFNSEADGCHVQLRIEGIADAVCAEPGSGGTLFVATDSFGAGTVAAVLAITLCLSANRGKMPDDPIIYAARDWISWLIFILVLSTVIAANRL